MKAEKKGDKMGILDARELACYIKKYYEKTLKLGIISPLKLQKSLYFCFAYWGGFMRNNNLNKNLDKEIQMNYSEYLFDNVIEAWVYGPVVPDVYHESDLDSFENEKIFEGMADLQEFINNVLNDVLPTNDFKLVEISHEDKCWKNNFKKKNIYHNMEIPKEDIIKEYAKIS